MRRWAWLSLVFLAACANTAVGTAARPSRPPATPRIAATPEPSAWPTPGFLSTSPTPGPRPTARPTATPTPAPATTPIVACPDGTATNTACGVPVTQPDGTTALYLATNATGTQSFTFNVAGTNLAATQVKALGTLTHDQPVLVAVLGPKDRTLAWRDEWHDLTRPGDYRAKPDATAYHLPYAPGTSHMLSQGWNGAFSHQGKHALDWTMPVGTPVLAARGGLVTFTNAEANTGGSDPALKDSYPVNEVDIQHDDGTIGMYLHLAYHGVMVKAGDRVQTGQEIALSGNTGFSSGPHLHFECHGPDEQLAVRTFPVLFDLGGTVGQPQEGKSYPE